MRKRNAIDVYAFSDAANLQTRPIDVPRLTELQDAHAQRPGAFVIMQLIGEFIPAYSIRQVEQQRQRNNEWGKSYLTYFLCNAKSIKPGW